MRTSNGLGSKDKDTDVTKKKTWRNKYKCNALIYQIYLKWIILRRGMKINRRRG